MKRVLFVFVTVLLNVFICVAQKPSQEAKFAMTGNTVMVNDTLLYEAPRPYPNLLIPEEVAKGWNHFRETVERGTISILQTSDGNFIDVLTDGNYREEMKRKISRIKLLPGKLNGKPCASIGVDTYVGHLNVKTPEGLPLMRTMWYPILIEE